MPQIQPLRQGDPGELGAYRVEGRLGEGAQGVVYAGVGPDGTKVAIKLLRTVLNDSVTEADKFLREVSAARRVAQFCTARVYGAYLDGERPYIVSELVEGISLQRIVQQEGPRGGGALHRLAVGTITALAAIHRAGIVHRDFKPSNVLLGPDGPRVIDFGIARALDSSTSLTTGIVGTPAYMSPEQITAQRVGPASDMFSWAVTMTYAATGRPAFGFDSLPAVIYRVMNEQPDLSGLPDELREVVGSCLSKRPDKRPTAPEALFALLDHTDPNASPGVPIVSFPGTDPNRADPNRADPTRADSNRADSNRADPKSAADRIHPPLAAPVAAPPVAEPVGDLASAAVADAAPTTPVRRDPRKALQAIAATGGEPDRAPDDDATSTADRPSSSVPPTSSVPPPGSPALPLGSPDSPPPAGPAAAPGSSAKPVKPKTGPVRPPIAALTSHPPAPPLNQPLAGNALTPPGQQAGEPEGRIEEERSLRLPPPDPFFTDDGSSTTRLKRAGLVGSALALALALAATALFVVPSLVGDKEPARPIALMSSSATPVANPVVSTPVASATPAPTVSTSPAAVPPPEIGKIIGKPLTGHSAAVYSVSVATVKGTPVVVSVGLDRTIRTWNANRRAAYGRPLSGHGDHVYAVATAKSGSRTYAVTGSRDGTVRVWDLTKRKYLGSLRGQRRAAYSVAIGKVGSRLVVASGGEDGYLRLWDLKKRKPIGRAVRAHKNVINWLSFGVLDGKAVVVTASEDRTLRVWRASTRKPIGKRFTAHKKPVYAVTTAVLDGVEVAISGGEDEKIRVWNLKTGKRVGKTMSGHKNNIYSLAYGKANDHPYLVSGSTDGTIRLWNLETFKQVGKSVKAHKGGVLSVAVTKIDGDPVIVSAGKDKRVRMWRVKASVEAS